jgi:hypothetical protein
MAKAGKPGSTGGALPSIGQIAVFNGEAAWHHGGHKAGVV